MARDPRYDILFEPVQIGPKVMRNRFMQAPHCSGAGSEHPRINAHMRANKAEGGWGAVFVEAGSISPMFTYDPHTLVRLWDDGDVRNLRMMTDMVHDQGSLAGFEIMYNVPLFSATEWNRETRAPALGAGVNSFTSSDIKEVRRLYVEAAQRCVDAGFDLINLMEYIGIGIGQTFLFPGRNNRTDEYGGSFENRARLFRELCEDLQDTVGDNCAIGLRINVGELTDDIPPFSPVGDAMVPTSYLAESLELVDFLDDVVDFWDVQGLANYGPSSFWPQNFNERFVRDIKGHTSKPVITVGRFTDPNVMQRMVREGLVDIIGAARPTIADPFLPKKIEEGRLEDIRECIGCNMCVSRWEQGALPIVCTQNATMMEEFRRGWHPEKFTVAKNADKSVLIVGAGPAGLECARVLGERKMEFVHVVDAAPTIGGSMRWIPRLPGLGEWGRVVDYRDVQIGKLKNVQLIMNTRLSVDDILDYGAEIVIIATGSVWSPDGSSSTYSETIPGADATLPHVLTPEQIMEEGKRPVGSRVVIYDGDGYFMGYTLALKLVAEGFQVKIVTSGDTVAPYTKFTDEWASISSALHQAGVEVIHDQYLTEVSETRTSLMHRITFEATEIETDNVVLVTGRLPRDEIYRELRERADEVAAAGIIGVYHIGDCINPDFISEAVFSGHRLGREIDSPDPSTPLPYIRDRNLLNPDASDFVRGSASLVQRIGDDLSVAVR
ncbi:oxidoreductase [Rhodococcus sp. NBC_00297]|uniref:oxidoreductase n=1 Tax=Rhodococcus sp. NBC_00297 TaxID=2976005 RepID=UPI002E2D7235|nr:FAD-dependent oxidoreductase [Rhodococcus sp. NBC_00297]